MTSVVPKNDENASVTGSCGSVLISVVFVAALNSGLVSDSLDTGEEALGGCGFNEESVAVDFVDPKEMLGVDLGIASVVLFFVLLISAKNGDPDADVGGFETSSLDSDTDGDNQKGVDDALNDDGRARTLPGNPLTTLPSVKRYPSTPTPVISLRIAFCDLLRIKSTVRV